MEKMTCKKALEFVLSLEEVQANVEICEKLTTMLVQVDKKNAKSDTPTKTQQENAKIKEVIVEFLENAENPCQVKDIVAEIGYSSQKISALVKQLCEADILEKTVEKKVSYFSVK